MNIKEIDEYIVDALFREMIEDISSRPKTKPQGELVIVALNKTIERIKERFGITDENRIAAIETGRNEVLP